MLDLALGPGLGVVVCARALTAEQAIYRSQEYAPPAPRWFKGGCLMKMLRFMTPLALVMATYAQQPSQRPPQQSEQQQPKSATQQQVGHVVRVSKHASYHTTSVYNAQTGQYSYGGGTSAEVDTEIQVGSFIYECPRIHKDVQVGKDYPVTIETDKHGNARKLTLTVGEKAYTYRIAGTREAKSD